MGKYRWNEFDQIGTSCDLTEYISEKPFNHGGYCHYTSLGVINSILSGRAFWLSCVSGFNDMLDSDSFGNNGDKLKYYSLCFSTGINENLPLWYIYSGQDGKGGRIRFTKSAVKKLYLESRMELWLTEDNRLQRQIMPLDRNKDIRVDFKDVVYFKENKDIADLKYNTMTNHCFPMSEFRKYKADNTGFCKGLIWFYEKETRLLVTLNDSIVRKINPNLKENQKYVIVLYISDSIYNSMHIEFAPEINNLDEVLNNIAYPQIKEFITDTSKASLSSYHGTIHMKI